jgi:hypothetical protein
MFELYSTGHASFTEQPPEGPQIVAMVISSVKKKRGKCRVFPIMRAVYPAAA